VTLTLTLDLINKNTSLEHVPYIKLARITKYSVWMISGDACGVFPTIHRSMWLWPLLFRHNIALGAFVTLLWPCSCLFDISLKNWTKSLFPFKIVPIYNLSIKLFGSQSGASSGSKFWIGHGWMNLLLTVPFKTLRKRGSVMSCLLRSTVLKRVQ